MDGLMMDRPLLIKQIAERAETVFGEREIVARTQDGVERSTYGRVVERARRLASALVELGVRPGDRVASFGVELDPPPRALPRASPAWAPFSTRSTSGCSRRISATSSTTPATG